MTREAVGVVLAILEGCTIAGTETPTHDTIHRTGQARCRTATGEARIVAALAKLILSVIIKPQYHGKDLPVQLHWLSLPSLRLQLCNVHWQYYLPHL